jgi:DNA end-binding protein Ku
VLSPAEGQESGYDLLCSVLRQTGKALMGTSVLVGAKSTRAVMVRFFRESLIAHVCTYDANIDWNTQALVSKAYGERPQPDPSLEQMAMQVIASLPETFDLSSVTDEYDERVREAIEAEAKGVKPKRAPAPEPKPVSDLMAALVASVEAVKGEKKPARKRVKA